MSRYAKIDRRIQSDARVQALSRPQPNGQSLWMYLLCNPHMTNIPGVFCAGEAMLAEALGWPLEGFREAFREVTAQALAKADWKARLVFVPNAIKYNAPESPNVVKSWATPWSELPECALKNEARARLWTFVEGMSKGFQEAFREACPEPSAKAMPNQKQEQEQKQIPPLPPAGGDVVSDALAALSEAEATKPKAATKSRAPTPQEQAVFDHWRKVMNKPAQTTLSPERLAKVRARLGDGYTVDQLCRAIDGCARSPHNMGANDRRTLYNDLELICRTATHVDRFASAGGAPIASATVPVKPPSRYGDL